MVMASGWRSEGQKFETIEIGYIEGDRDK